MTGALPPSIRPLAPGMRVCGPAFPVRSPGGDNLMLHRAIAAAPPGSVIVADAGFYEKAGPWGDLMTLSALQAGIAGLIITGAVRDGDDIIDLGFPVFCIGRCIIGTTKTWQGPVPEPVRIGQTIVNPSDIVVGDNDGVVIVPYDMIDATIEASRQRENKEIDLRQRMKNGESLQTIMGFLD